MYKLCQTLVAVYSTGVKLSRGGSQRQDNAGALAGQETIEGHDDPEEELDSRTFTKPTSPVCKHKQSFNQNNQWWGPEDRNGDDDDDTAFDDDNEEEDDGVEAEEEGDVDEDEEESEEEDDVVDDKKLRRAAGRQGFLHEDFVQCWTYTRASYSVGPTRGLPTRGNFVPTGKGLLWTLQWLTRSNHQLIGNSQNL